MGFISIEQSDNLFWLGRYAERVYRTIRSFEALCDVMLDIDEQAYKPFCAALNIPDIYKDSLDFIDAICMSRRIRILSTAICRALTTMDWCFATPFRLRPFPIFSLR